MFNKETKIKNEFGRETELERIKERQIVMERIRACFDVKVAMQETEQQCQSWSAMVASSGRNRRK